MQLNQALLLLPWTMHALIILKRYRAAGGSSESGSCGPCPLLPGDLSPTAPWMEEEASKLTHQGTALSTQLCLSPSAGKCVPISPGEAWGVEP